MREGLKARPIAPGRGIENRFFSEWRLGFYASGVAIGYVLALAWYLIRHRPDNDQCVDFTWIWLSSKFALSGALAQAYDYSVFSAVRDAIVGPPNCSLQHLDYPPTFLLFTSPLALMPYSVAFAVWMGATLLLYLAAVYAIIPRWPAVIAAVRPFPVIFNILLGHNGFLTAGLIGLVLALMERRPGLSGIFLGFLTYKPQFGILFPFALLVSGNWRVPFSATATTVVFGLTAAFAFGYQAWPAFIAALVERASSLSQDPTLNLPLVSVLGFLQVLGVNAHSAWAVQLAVTVITAVAVCALWARPISYPLKAAALAIGSILAAPHAIGYDVCILSIAVAFLVRDGLSRGFLPHERTAMLMCWAGLILLAGPMPAIISVVLLVLVVRRTTLCQANATAAPRPLLKARRRYYSATSD